MFQLLQAAVILAYQLQDISDHNLRYGSHKNYSNGIYYIFIKPFYLIYYVFAITSRIANGCCKAAK